MSLAKDHIYSKTEFQDIIISQVQVSTKNKLLLKKLKSSTNPLENTNSSPRAYLSIIDDLDTQDDIKVKKKSRTQAKSLSQSLKMTVEPFSSFLLFIVHGKSLKNMIPDYEFIKSTETYNELIKTSQNCDEAYFNLGKIKCYEGDLTKATLFFTKAIQMKQNNKTYFLWKLIISIQLSYGFPYIRESKSFFCCANREKVSKKHYLKDITERLEDMPQSIESLWGLMEISCFEVLKTGEEIEPSRHYASRIKAIDEYYGYLAWASIYQKEGSYESIEALISIIKNYSDRPEAYVMAFNYYYYRREFENAKSIALEAFSKITNGNYKHYYILFSLKLSKSLYITGKFVASLELLHKKYLEYPSYPVFLYYFSKFCVQSEDQELKGVAKGILKELLRLCDNSRIGCIRYWLTRSYMSSRNYPEAYSQALKAICALEMREKTKIMEMKKIMYEIKSSIDKIEKIKGNIRRNTIDDSIMMKCEEIKDFNRSTGDLLYCDIYILQGQTDKAIETLKKLISTCSTEINAFFKLLQLEPESSDSIFKEMLKRAKEAQIPTQVWVKCNLVYSKYLFRIGQDNRAFFILRMMAKVLPPLPYSDIPYCLALKAAQSFDELSIAYTQVSRRKNSNYPKKTSFFNIRDYTNNFLEDFVDKIEPNILENPLETEKSSKVNRKVNTSFSELNSEDENWVYKHFSSPNSNKSTLSTFCISSKPKFLYYIAKFSIILRKNKEEGLLALNDYFELMKLEKVRSKADKRNFKASILKRDLINLIV